MAVRELLYVNIARSWCTLLLLLANHSCEFDARLTRRMWLQHGTVTSCSNGKHLDATTQADAVAGMLRAADTASCVCCCCRSLVDRRHERLVRD